MANITQKGGLAVFGVLAGLFLATPLAFAQQGGLLEFAANTLTSSQIVNQYGVATAAAIGLMVLVAFAMLFMGVIQEIGIFKSALASTALAFILAIALAFFGAIAKVVAGMAAGAATFTTLVIFGVLFMGMANWARRKAFEFGYTGLFAITGEGLARLKSRGAWLLAGITGLGLGAIGGMIGSSGFVIGGIPVGLFLGAGVGFGLGFLWGLIEVLRKPLTAAEAVKDYAAEAAAQMEEYGKTITQLQNMRDTLEKRTDIAADVKQRQLMQIQEMIDAAKYHSARVAEAAQKLIAGTLTAEELKIHKEAVDAAKSEGAKIGKNIKKLIQK